MSSSQFFNKYFKPVGLREEFAPPIGYRERILFAPPIGYRERILPPPEPGEDTLRDTAREKFWHLMAASSKGKPMLEALQRDILPLFRARNEQGLRKAVYSWANTYHLVLHGKPPDWVLANVESTLLAWCACSHPPLVWSLTGERIIGQKTRKQLPTDQQFRWAVQFQIDQREVADIVKHENSPNYAVLVSQGIAHVLELIGLTRRPGRIGRPSKKL
jgi:hypothetical protein